MNAAITERVKAAVVRILAHPSEVFLVLAVVFGVVFCFRLVPLSGTDEFTHFPRAYQIQDGKLTEQKLPDGQFGGYIPVNIDRMVSDYRDLSRKSTGEEFKTTARMLNSEYALRKDAGVEHVPAVFGSDAVYPPWSYFPSIIGIRLARAFGLPLLWYVYIARLFTLFVWILLVWFAIRLLPEGKWFLVVVALLPTSITQAATIGLDGLVCGISWLIIASVFAVLAKRIALKSKNLLLILSASLALCIVKQGYWLIALWPLVIPKKYFSSSRISRIWKALILVSVACLSLMFGAFTRHITSDIVLTPRLGVFINSQLQLTYVLHHPMSFVLRSLLQPFTKSFDTVFLGLVGIITNRLVYLSVLVIGLLYLGLFLAFSQTKKIPELLPQNARLIVSSCLVIIGTYLFVSLALYLAFTEVGSPEVSGVSGRYFLPLLPLMLTIPFTSQPKFKIERLSFSLLILVSITVGLVSTVFSLV